MIEWNLETLIKNIKISKEGSKNIFELHMRTMFIFGVDVHQSLKSRL